MYYKRVCILFLALLTTFLSVHSNAEERVLGGRAISVVEEAIEGVPVSFVFDKQGKVVEVIVNDCIGCRPIAFVPEASLVVKIGRKVVPASAELNGRKATVFYDRQSKDVTKVNFFELQ